ncbi:glycosyltransferase [soil metagenome]
MDPTGPCSVVIATCDRRASLLHTIERLVALPEQPAVIVVDNGSSDGSAEAVRSAFPEIDVVALDRNLGAPARNIGVRRAETPYVAFADDDSWWAPGALARAADLFDAHPTLGLIGARILVGAEEREDPTTAVMAASPLAAPPGLPGPAVLGFLACGAVVRRSAFLEVGGFDELLFFLGEEQRVALDLAAGGWHLTYDHTVVAHHHPSPPGDPVSRRRRQLRNDVLTAWLRRPARVAVARTASLVSAALRGDRTAGGALGEVLVHLPRACRSRAPVPHDVEFAVRALE